MDKKLPQFWVYGCYKVATTLKIIFNSYLHQMYIKD